MLNVIFAIFSQILTILIAVAYLTLLERKIMAAIQRRCAGLKLFAKEIIIPVKANKKLFVLAPLFFFGLSNNYIIIFFCVWFSI